MWARERRVWASGGEASASPGLVHTVHTTTLGPKDASTSSALGAAMVAAVVSAPFATREELARAGGWTPPGHGRCSFATRRGLPASNTLVPRRGVMQGSSAVRITPTGDVRWHATAPMRARARAGRSSIPGPISPPGAERSNASSEPCAPPGCATSPLLYFSSFAYVLMQSLRALGAQGTELARAQVSTLRLKLLKVGTRIRITARRVWLSFSQAYPYARVFAEVLANLQREPLWREPG